MGADGSTHSRARRGQHQRRKLGWKYHTRTMHHVVRPTAVLQGDETKAFLGLAGDGPTSVSNGFMIPSSFLLSSHPSSCMMLQPAHNRTPIHKIRRRKKLHWKIDFTAMANPFVNLTHSLLVEMQDIDQLMQVHRWSCLA